MTEAMTSEQRGAAAVVSGPVRDLSEIRTSRGAGARTGPAAWSAGGRGGAGEIVVDDGARDVPPPVPGEVGRVLVLGAGVAGLVAARALAAAGVEVVVLEGRGRIGGRIETIELAGAPVDLGAAWVHDPRAPVRAYLDALGVALGRAAVGARMLEARVLDPIARAYPAEALERALAAAIRRLEAGGPALAAAEPGLSVRAAVDRLLAGAPARVRDTIASVLGSFDGADASELPLGALAAMDLGGDDRLPRGGYGRLVEPLARGLEIRLGTAVAAVEEVAGGVRLRTAGGELVDGTHAIVTAPLGVLASGAIAFSPGLPARKREALARAGFGAYEKVALAFPEPFWQLGGPSDIVVASGAAAGFRGFLDLSRWVGRPVLVAASMGAHARELARLPEAERAARALALLGARPGAIPAPLAVRATAWAADPFSLGCYVHARLGVPLAEAAALPAALAEPHGRVLFAGEATSAAAPGTVDGAWRSGVREAKRLLRAAAVRLPA